MVASQNGLVEVVDKLLQHGATVDLQHQVITTPIYKYNTIYNHILHNKLVNKRQNLLIKFMPHL